MQNWHESFIHGVDFQLDQFNLYHKQNRISPDKRWQLLGMRSIINHVNFC